MVACGPSGVLMKFMGCMRRVCGKILEGVGGSFLFIPNLRWEMTSKLDYDMASGMGIRSLRNFFFLDLHSIVCVKDAFVADYLELSNNSHKWNVSFIKDAHEREVEVFASFFNLLYSFRLR
jgi:hypothetical protein